MKLRAASSFWAVSGLLWLMLILGGVVAVAGLMHRLPHQIPLLGLPLDQEGLLQQAIDTATRKQAICLPSGSAPAAPAAAEPNAGQTPRPAEQTPPPAAAPTAAPTGAAAQPLKSQDLSQRLEHAAVLVLTDNASGSGFFISPNHIVTNRHVVEAQSDRQVAITSKALGRAMQGRVIAITLNNTVGAPDFAVIEVDDVPSAQPLALGTAVVKLQKIVVAGYPGLVLDDDLGFQKLLKGDVSAAPDLNLTEGSVTTMQTTEYGLTKIAHSATVLKGNSGGPLVDSCSRVVGINTFIAVDESQSGHINYALSVNDLAKFLRDKHIDFTTDSKSCG